MRVYFCHGLESGPHGSKYQALRDAGLDVISPDFQGQRLSVRVDALLEILRDAPPCVLVGSSYGGITAVCAAQAHADAGGDAVRGLVLCAPALTIDESPARDNPIRFAAPTTIIHGVHDDVVPIAPVRAIAEELGARWVERDDDHRLADSRATIVAETIRMIEESATTPRAK